MKPPIRDVVISESQLKARIKSLAREIEAAFPDQEIVMVSILKGAFIFLADLMREVDRDIEVGFLYLSSYRGEVKPQGDVEDYLIPFPPIRGRAVLLVEDIFDSGASLAYAYQRCLEQNPSCLRVCVLLEKEMEREADLVPPLDFVGFQIPDRFVVGYGLDYREKYRQLNEIVVPELSEADPTQPS
jgi:hypoxanthine phosphoribosyltransferase